MQWENLTAPDFAAAVKETGLCVIAMGVVENHADHLPLGTDFLNGHKLACLAAEQEPAVVFPPFYFGQIYEARCFPGALAIKPALLLELIIAVLDDIGRNGFKKIVLVNAHGGNGYLLPFIAQSSLWEQKPYTVYFYRGQLSPAARQTWQETIETKLHGHGCECETSISLANHPELVHMERVPEPETGATRGRLSHISGGMSGIWWYGDYPDHYAGDARTASAEKGKTLRGLEVEALAAYLKAVKEDTATSALEKEFFEREAGLRG